MQPLVIANWKMNLTEPQVSRFLEQFLTLLDSNCKSRILFAPSFPSLGTAATLLAGTPVGVASQDVFPEEKGAFTGAVSAAMLAAIGCSHVLVGHSERRQIWGEDDALVRRKLLAALGHGLCPVLCVGETAKERQEGHTAVVVERQVRAALGDLERDDLSGIAVAYEPVWAIGTGDSASPEQAEEVHAGIRALLQEILPPPAGASVPVLYGGSVTARTAPGLLAQPTINGLLVGSASLEPASFAAICAASPGAP